MAFNRIRERINLTLYNSKDKVLSLLSVSSFIVSVGTLLVLLYYYGFPQSSDSRHTLVVIIRASFTFFIARFILRWLYDFQPREFFRRHWSEVILMLILIVEGLAYNLTGSMLLPRAFEQIGIYHTQDISTLIIQAYFFVLVFVEILNSDRKLLPNLRLHPATVFMLSFVAIIFFGALLLMMPEMTVIEGSMDFTQALFMSTSATCVTGLGIVDTATFFTHKGHVIILILIKLGGLNIIAFGFFFLLLNKIGLGVKHDSLIEDFVNRNSIVDTKSTFGKIVVWSTLIELIGAFLMFMFWDKDVKFAGSEVGTIGDKIFSSIFHSVSAFNNAGLSLFSDGLFHESIRNNWMIHLNVTMLVFVGALGFASIFDLFDVQNLRERLKYPWKQVSFSTKIAVYFSLGLVIAGTLFYFWLERNNTLEGYDTGEALITSLFQSVTRTSGFNSADIGSIGAPMLFMMVVLMFIGSSSSSTGGGIKTSTFAILWASLIATITGKKHAELFKRTISNDLILKSFAIFLFFVAGNMICIFLLSITESHLFEQGFDIMDLIFEEVSAFGTVGLSTGLTPNLSEAGKYIIILSMFVGRVGTLTVAYLFGKSVISKAYKYPEGHTMVG